MVAPEGRRKGRCFRGAMRPNTTTHQKRRAGENQRAVINCDRPDIETCPASKGKFDLGMRSESADRRRNESSGANEGGEGDVKEEGKEKDEREQKNRSKRET